MKYYCIKQHDITDCGAACIATISRQYGLKTSISRIREIAGTDKSGTNIVGVVKAAEELGFSAKGVKGDKESFFSDFPLPAIAHIITKDGLQHYVVIHKITKEKIVLADPAIGIVKLKHEDFFNIWTGVLVITVPKETFKKGKDTSGTFERFFSLILPQKRLVFEVFFASIIITLLGITGAFYFQYIIDEILPGELKQTLLVISIGVILLKLFSVLLSVIRTQLLIHLSQKLDIALLLGYYNHVLKLPMNFFGTRKIGEIVSRFQDATAIREAISSVTLTVMIDTLMAIGGGIILLMKNVQLFLISFILIIIYGMLVFIFNKPYKRANQRQMEDNAQLTSFLVESLNGMQTVKAFNGEYSVETETEFKFVKLIRSIFRLSCIGNIQEGLKAFFETIGGIVIVWVGALSVMDGGMTIGSLLSFNALLVYFLDPVKNIIDLQPDIQTALVAADRLSEILDLEIEKYEENGHKVEVEKFNGNISIENVTFRYGTRHAVLENFSFEVKAGETVAIVGESGSGKSTLAKLLLNMYKAESGVIELRRTLNHCFSEVCTS